MGEGIEMLFTADASVDLATGYCAVAIAQVSVDYVEFARKWLVGSDCRIASYV